MSTENISSDYRPATSLSNSSSTDGDPKNPFPFWVWVVIFAVVLMFFILLEVYYPDSVDVVNKAVDDTGRFISTANDTLELYNRCVQ